MRIRRFLKARKLTPRMVPVWLLGMAIAAIWISPFALMISASLAPPGSSQSDQWFPHTIVLDNYTAIFERYPVFQWAFNSIVVTVVGTALGVTLAAMAGFALARLTFPGKAAIFGLVLATIMIPAEMSIVPLFIGFLTVGLGNTLAGILLPSIASVIGLFIFRQFFLGLPRELDDAAEIDGASKFAIFTRIAMPLSKGPTLAVTILLFASNWNAYTWPLLMALTEDTKTLPVGLAQLSPPIAHGQSIAIGSSMAGATLLTIPTLLVFLVLQRYFIEGVTRSGIRG